MDDKTEAAFLHATNAQVAIAEAGLNFLDVEYPELPDMEHIHTLIRQAISELEVVLTVPHTMHV